MMVAKSRGLLTVGMTGEGGGKLAAIVDHLFAAPSKDTPRIQEVHHLMNHILCDCSKSDCGERAKAEGARPQASGPPRRGDLPAFLAGQQGERFGLRPAAPAGGLPQGLRRLASSNPRRRSAARSCRPGDPRSRSQTSPHLGHGRARVEGGPRPRRHRLDGARLHHRHRAEWRGDRARLRNRDRRPDLRGG